MGEIIYVLCAFALLVYIVDSIMSLEDHK